MDIKTDLVLSGTHTVSSMTTDGFVKNSTAGLFSSNTLSKARAYCSSAATVNNTQSLIPLDYTNYDTDSIVSLANDRIVPKKAGYYFVTGQLVILTPASNGWSFAGIWVNGSWHTQGTVHVNLYTVDALGLGSAFSVWVDITTPNSDYI